jgi:DNA methylase
MTPEDRIAAYRGFLAAKAQLAPVSGIDIDPGNVHRALKPHQRDAVLWAARGGRRAIFASFGLGKSLMQLEAERLILRETGGRGLIVCPLGVRQEFARDARLIDIETTFIRSAAEASRDGIYLTNYESVRDGKLDPRGFDVVSLDEAAILRGFGGTKTFRELMRLYEGSAAFRFVATATPSPNEYIELLSYAAFLDILDVGQGKTRFFKRDSAHADRLTLHPHMEDEFWTWVASWALFLQKPSDLGHPDTGYDLPPLDIRWHEVESPLAPLFGEGQHKDGQGFMFRDAAFGIQEAAAEKRMNMGARVAKTAQIVAESPGDHFLLWHDLEDERRAIEAAVPETVSVWGSQDLDERERRIAGFGDGEFRILSTKPVIAGSGCNFQRHCHRAVFTGIGFKFADFIQAVHRIHRFLQGEPVRIDIVYSEAERGIKAQLERKWQQHDELVARMGEIIRGRDLARAAVESGLARSAGVRRQEVSGTGYLLVNNDSVEECAAMADNSVGLIVTSIPFATQYEYTPSYNDFGHTEDNAHFWAQMDYLTPELFRFLAPGRIAAVHVKDRITPGGLSGLGFQTLHPFHAEAIQHYRGHGFALMAQITVVTDVVRENNQTYRLGWTECTKDGTKMGAGVPEYVLVFRKPPTDSATSYADTPVARAKRDYSRARWQVDAHGFWRSSGNRPLLPEEFGALSASDMFKRFRDHQLANVYDYRAHVGLGEHLEDKARLPSGFMLLQPPSHHPDVWTDVARMRTLNLMQHHKGQQFHLCPLQFDIVERLIDRYSAEGDTVLDPFGGLMTVPYCAVKMGRRGVGIELNSRYFADGAAYVKAAAEELAAPTLFDLPGVLGEAS